MGAEVLRLIGNISRALDSIANVEFKDLNLNRGQYLYLVRIYEHPQIILEELALMLRVDKTTASRAVNKLVNQGLIKKQTDHQSLKRQLLSVTDEGAKLAKFILKENDYSENQALKGVDYEQIKQLISLLEMMDVNLLSDYQLVKSGKTRNY